jgi:two-component system chemotaxis response regulator CheB
VSMSIGTRILVVEDSVTIRKALVEILDQVPDFKVVGEAEDGNEATRLCHSLRPDIVTMDMVLPVMNGLAATEHIMAYCPTPILIVSASTNRGDLFRTYDALAAGAVDVLEKMPGGMASRAWEDKLVSTVRLVSRIKVITHLRGRVGALHSLDRPARVPSSPPVAATRRVSNPRAVVIGASTGGPGALIEILGDLPPAFPLPILLVLHLGEPFAAAFAEWLDGHSQLRVRYAKNGEALPPIGHGCVLMAPPNAHLEVSNERLHLSYGPERHSCRPSVDVLFESVARELGARSVACLLTGMGKDGSQGLLAIQRAGGTTIAQDEATCVVYGMPREAALLGAADRVLPLRSIAPALVALAGLPSGRGA